MSGSESSRAPVGLAGVLFATTTFRGYRTAAIITYLISDAALFGAAAAYFFIGLGPALAIGAVAVVFTLIALRCGQIVFARNTYADRIPANEHLEFEFGARRPVAFSRLRSPVLVLVTDRAIHAFRVGLVPREPIASVERSEGASIRQSPTVDSGDVDLQLGDQSIALRGMSQDSIDRASALLA